MKVGYMVSKRFWDSSNRSIAGGEMLEIEPRANVQCLWSTTNEQRMLDESTILRFCHLLEEHGLGQQILATVKAKLIDLALMLKTGTALDATLISPPSTTKNDSGERDSETHQTKKDNPTSNF